MSSSSVATAPCPSVVNPARPRFRWRWRWFFLSLFLAPFIGIALIVCYGLSCLLVSSTVRELGSAAIHDTGGHWNWKVSARVGAIPLTLARVITEFVPTMPHEARQALSAARGGEVMVYQRTDHRKLDGCRQLLADADRIMTGRGWERAVGVLEDGNLVAVYLPVGLDSNRRARATVLVVNEDTLVVASATADLRPLFTLALQKFRESNPQHLFLAKR